MGTRGYQFIHIEAFARKADGQGRSVDYILSEAERRADACTHVAIPCPPEVIFGSSLADLRITHDSMAASAMATIAGGKTRKIRQDQLTLLTVVVSHPATVAEARADPAVASEVADWEQRVLTWLRQRWGDDLGSVVRHTDEKHAHLHAFVLPRDTEMRARKLHPGASAKETAKTAALAEGANAKAANATGDKAYRAAMRDLQDGFWHEVGIPCGLARIGPARRRLTRAQWHAEKAAVRATAEVLRVADVARAEAEAARHDAAVVTSGAEKLKAAAESLRTRAETAARRAQEAIEAARQRAAEATAAADAAEAARAEAERQAMRIAARGRRVLEQARSEARRILGTARTEAEQMGRRARGLGAWLGALVQGLRGVSPATVAKQAAAAARADERAIAADREALSRAEAERTEKELRQTQTRLAAVGEAAANLGAQRDRLSREVERLRHDDPLKPAPALRPK